MRLPVRGLGEQTLQERARLEFDEWVIAWDGARAQGSGHDLSLAPRLGSIAGEGDLRREMNDEDERRLKNNKRVGSKTKGDKHCALTMFSPPHSSLAIVNLGLSL